MLVLKKRAKFLLWKEDKLMATGNRSWAGDGDDDGGGEAMVIAKAS